MKYAYELSGMNREENTWSVEGELELPGDKGDLLVAAERVLSEAFLKLTKGEAVYGHPGVGCQGPYRVRHLSIDVREP